MAKAPRRSSGASHGAHWVRQGFALIEAYEAAQREREERARSGDPDAVAEAVLEGPVDTPILPASGDLFAFPTLSPPRIPREGEDEEP